jgi:hypothetical protein
MERTLTVIASEAKQSSAALEDSLFHPSGRRKTGAEL